MILRHELAVSKMQTYCRIHHSHLLEDLLHIYPVEAGDCVFVPAGTIHALGPGILLAEIQQQSNLTFRLYDWGKLGSDGQPRPVHIQESLTCTDFARGPVFPVVAQQLCDQEHGFEELVRCEYFVVRRHTSLHPFSLLSDGRFRILMTLAGSGTVDTSTGAEALVLGGQFFCRHVVSESGCGRGNACRFWKSPARKRAS